ncbi:MAG: hypothetical protein LGR52_04545 [Candidatus Thiosymbion ectosymbiont of Robbea hypermnestra]|nr:hypothetical protein [Candidatus Thiosymbion ectosymbiont of Robbea hypermnestra]
MPEPVRITVLWHPACTAGEDLVGARFHRERIGDMMDRGTGPVRITAFDAAEKRAS